MKVLFPVILLILFFACSPEQSNSIEKDGKSDTVVSKTNSDIVLIDASALEDKIIDSLNYELCYVTIADTGRDYFVLHKLMDELSPIMGLRIDTLGKEFNVKKQKIAVPENDDDEMYRGEYYPRRYTGNSLSLEYLNFYYGKSSEENMALVTNICSQRDSAFYYAKKIPQGKGHVFVIRSNLYVGCMH